MKKLAFILLFALGPLLIRAQFGCTCLPEGITFSTQEQIDNFQVNYPGCNGIIGNVTISSYGITNLLGLNKLVSIGGNLSIDACPVGDYLSNNYTALPSLTGLDNLTSIGGDLSIQCQALTSLTGLGNLTSIGGDLLINRNYSLTSLTGLENLTSIGGSLGISGNDSLTSLTGLEHLAAIGGRVVIAENPSLSACEVQSICDYLASPNGDIDIYDNAPGCNSRQEVELACETVGIQESAVSSQQSAVRVFPNPVSDKIIVECGEKMIGGTLWIYNLHGQEVLRQLITQATTVLDISHLPTGLYFYRTWTMDNGQSTMGKLVKW